MNAIKTLFLICFCLTMLAWRVIGQSPSMAAQAAAPVASVSPAVTASPSGSADSDLEKAIKHKTKRHFGFTIDGNDKDIDHIMHHGGGDDDMPAAVFPIVAIVMMTVFGAPVLIVGLIMYFSFSKSRAMHRTVRMLVEKGQPVPEALLAPRAPAVRQRSDMRRGVVLVMVGLGVMLFLAAVNEWEGGAWTLGLIPFLIGCGYLLVWKLEGGKKEIPPPPPAA